MSSPFSREDRGIVVYGLSNCDTVRRARAWLTSQGAPHDFHDFKRAGLAPVLLDEWIARLGWVALLNKQGLTWKKLDFELRETVNDLASARDLMLQLPSIIRRPVVHWRDVEDGPDAPESLWTIGFDEARWASLLPAVTAAGSAPSAI